MITNSLSSYKYWSKKTIYFLGKINKSIIYDDYAHHPTEIEATLESAKYLKNNLVVVFQPHRYSRTKNVNEFICKSFSKVDDLIILDTYSAGEKISGATSKDMYLKLIKVNKNTIYLKNIKNLNIILSKYTLKKI